MYFGYIYKFTLIPTGKIYVGKRQKSKFDESYYGSGISWLNEISNYKKEDIKREILEWCFSKEELLDREIYWIKKLNSTNPNIGYNLITVYNSGMTGLHIKHSKEWNNNIGLGNKGKKHSLKSKLNMSNGHKEYYKNNPDSRLKIGDQKRELFKDKVWLQKYKSSLKELWNNMDHINNIRDKVWLKNCKKVRCIETGEEFNSIKEATEKYKGSHISDVCLGKRKRTKGLTWEFI